MQRKTRYGEERLDALRVICQVPIRAFQEKAGLVIQQDWISLKL